MAEAPLTIRDFFYENLPKLIEYVYTINTYLLMKSQRGPQSGLRLLTVRSGSMPELGNQGARPKKRRPVLRIAAALLGAAVFCQPGLAHAAHGGGGFHGGGFHGGGFHAGGFHGGAFHHGAFHGGGSHSGVVGL